MSKSLPTVAQSLILSTISFSIYFGLLYISGDRPFARIPRDRKIEPSYMKPSAIEIILEDIDRNGSNETLLRCKGKKYLLRIDEQGKPTISDYEVKIVPK